MSNTSDARQICLSALRDGEDAAAEISRTVLTDMMKLPVNIRKEILDAGDERLDDLLPEHRRRLRESVIPPRPGTRDPAAKAAAELQEKEKKLQILREYIQAYTLQLEGSQDEIGFALYPCHDNSATGAPALVKALLSASPLENVRTVLKSLRKKWFVKKEHTEKLHEILNRLLAVARSRAFVQDEYRQKMEKFDAISRF